MRKAAFLDRDGVLNLTPLMDGVPKPPSYPSEVEILSGVFEAIQLIKMHNYLPVVITNQPDVARGSRTKEQIEAINLHIGSRLQIDHFYTCFHDDIDQCKCRKPAAGLIYQAAIELQLDVSRSFLVGDRWRDIAAGQAAGCECYFIDYSYPEKQPDLPYLKVLSLLDAVQTAIGAPNGI